MWIDSSLWQPESWSCYRQSVRTNNDVEAWHARLSRRTGAGNLGLYQLAGRLHDEGKLVALSMNVMPEAGVVKYQCSSTLRINARLDKLYDEYDAGRQFIPGGVFSFPGIRECPLSFPGFPGARE